MCCSLAEHIAMNKIHDKSSRKLKSTPETFFNVYLIRLGTFGDSDQTVVRMLVCHHSNLSQFACKRHMMICPLGKYC